MLLIFFQITQPFSLQVRSLLCMLWWAALFHLEHPLEPWCSAHQLINYTKHILNWDRNDISVPYSVLCAAKTWHLCQHFLPIPPWPAWIVKLWFSPGSGLRFLLNTVLETPVTKLIFKGKLIFILRIKPWKETLNRITWAFVEGNNGSCNNSTCPLTSQGIFSSLIMYYFSSAL